MIQQSGPTGWERVAMAIERVRERLLKVTRLLNESGIPYAVLGGNAVAEWVGRVDEAAVRFTQDVSESEDTRDFTVLQLDALLRMKLTANRDKDRTHVRDMLGVGLLDASWRDRLPPELVSRFQMLLDDPEG